MYLLPQPTMIKEKEGFLKTKVLKIDNKCSDERIINALRFFETGDGADLIIEAGTDNSEGYSLSVSENKIHIKGESPAGVFYAIQTLRQLFESNKVPCLEIEDKPDMMLRGFYHDVTRGKVPTVKTLKRLIDDMAYYKLNCLQLYVEHTFEFKEYSDSIDRTGYLTAEEIKELDEYCRLNFIEFIPSLATFGHLYELLQKDRYSHLRELENYESKNIVWHDRMMHHTIDPTNEESFELIKSLLDQYIVNFSTDKFNICCDETFDLKIGKHKDDDTGKLYVDFVRKIIEYLQSKGKGVMMWADILLNHPEQIESLPDGVELLNWFYAENPDESTIKTIYESGLPQIVCPGTGTWNRLSENYETEILNIEKMIDLGYKYKATGVLNTNWGDWGNPCSIELAMFGLVFGASKSWNVSTTADDEYISSVNNILYKSNNACMLIKRLAQISQTCDWCSLAKSYWNDLKGQIYDVSFKSEQDLINSVNECFSVIETAENSEWGEARYKNQIILAAEGYAVIAELLAKQAGYSVHRRTDADKWVEKYKAAWLEDNKESELREIEKMFSYLEQCK